MLFFNTLSLLFLAASTLARPAPVPDAHPGALESRCDTCDIVGIFTTLKASIQEPCDSLQVLVAADITVDIIQPHIDVITTALNLAIAQVKALDVSASVAVSLSTVFGSRSLFSVCSLMAEVSILLSGVLATVVKLLTTVNVDVILPILQAVVCLLADLHVCVFVLLNGTLSFALSLFCSLLFKALAPCHDYLTVIGSINYWIGVGIQI